jgi:hypothetical protein
LIDACEWPPKIKQAVKDKISGMVQEIDAEKTPLYMPINHSEKEA